MIERGSRSGGEEEEVGLGKVDWVVISYDAESEAYVQNLESTMEFGVRRAQFINRFLH